MRQTAAILVACFLLPLAAQSADSGAKLLAKSGDWESFTYNDKGGKVCYVASQPKRSVGAAKGRGNVFFTITHRPADKSIGVISVDAGFTYKKDAPAELDIGGAKFDLYTTGGSAWARNDKAVVAALLKGKSVIAHGTPAKGDPVADTFSLDGFAKAYGEINKACDVK
ncbi:MAG TPA: invasion associated locus B family protein [Magnetospirillaceae bacterium]|nr:invasion associated locus B family protein [Magnetospirillaceae bacterium]